ncbi:unnamed protein product, partial [Didymodactylos carnosus]
MPTGRDRDRNGEKNFSGSAPGSNPTGRDRDEKTQSRRALFTVLIQHESADYQWYQILRNTLLNMNTETDEAKKEMIDYCRKYYQKEEVVLGAIDEFERSYTSSCQAVQWYTRNLFPFNFVNKVLRAEDVNALFKLRYFIVALCKNL